MGGTNISKQQLTTGLIVAGGVGLAGVALYYATRPDDSLPKNANHIKIDENGSPTPVQMRGEKWTQRQNEIFDKLMVLYKEGKISNAEGGHLKPEFYSLFQDLIYLRVGKSINTVKQEKSPEIVADFSAFKFADYNKKVSELSKKIGEKEETETESLINYFDDPNFITASRIYLLKYNPDELLRTFVLGSKVKNQENLKVINQFNVSEVIKTIRAKINSRMSQGFEYVDKTNFPTEFRTQILMEVEAKHKVNFDEFWAFCSQEGLGKEQPEWDAMIEDYIKMLKTFYHSMQLFTPGLQLKI